MLASESVACRVCGAPVAQVAPAGRRRTLCSEPCRMENTRRWLRAARAAQKVGVKRQCAQCGGEVARGGVKERVFCSVPCGRRWWYKNYWSQIRPHVEPCKVICIGCGAAMLGRPDRRWCSEPCRRQNRERFGYVDRHAQRLRQEAAQRHRLAQAFSSCSTRLHDMECLQCGEWFMTRYERRAFCSATCRKKDAHRVAREARKGTCANCGVPLGRWKVAFCSAACQRRAYRRTEAFQETRRANRRRRRQRDPAWNRQRKRHEKRRLLNRQRQEATA